MTKTKDPHVRKVNGERWVAVADLHGHLDEFEALLEVLDREYGDDYRLCTLGDYVDNGPKVPELIDRLVELKAERGERFVPIVGNHDLACIRALGFPGTEPDEVWWKRWSGSHWDVGGETPSIYARHRGLREPRCARDFAEVLPVGDAHRVFLESLPWVHTTEDYVFVHAGMQAGTLGPQVHSLMARELPAEPTHQPPSLRDKTLSKVSDASWDRTVVSAHNKRIDGPWFVGPKRVCLSAEVDATGVLRAVVLPEMRFFSVERDGKAGLRFSDESPIGSTTTREEA